MFRYFTTVVPGGEAAGVGGLVLTTELLLLVYAMWRSGCSLIRRLKNQKTTMALELSTSHRPSDRRDSAASGTSGALSERLLQID